MIRIQGFEWVQKSDVLSVLHVNGISLSVHID